MTVFSQWFLRGWMGVSSLALCAESSAQEERETIRTGKYVKLICHFKNEQTANLAFESAEAAWDETIALFSAKVEPPNTPYEVHLYRHLEQYQEAEQALTKGKFRDNMAFSHWDSISSHVVLQPPCSDETLESLGLPDLTRALLIHETAHIASYCAVAAFRELPFWLNEGFARSVERAVYEKKGWVNDFEAQPYFSQSFVRAQRMLNDSQPSFPSVQDMVDDEWPEIHWRNKYAAADVLFQFLVGGQASRKFRGFLEGVRRMGGGNSQATAEIAKLLEKSLGRSRWKSLDKDLRKFIEKQDPVWDESFRSLDAADEDEWTQIAFAKTNAYCFRNEELGERFVIQGELEFLPQARRQMNVLLGIREGGFISVAILPGAVTVFVHRYEGNDWRRVGNVNAPDYQPGVPVSFKVESFGKELVVSLDGLTVGRFNVGDRGSSGKWGLAAQAGSGGFWRSVRVKEVKE